MKIIKNAEKRALGLLQRPDGTPSSGPEETLELLLKNHFPHCREVTPADEEVPENQLRHDRLENPSVEFITADKIALAIQTMGAYKAPGPDKLPAKVFRHVGPLALTRLQKIFRASVLLHYVPKEWRKASAIFIPKPGKDNYSHVRSFRPITLAPVIFKVLERVILWHLKDTTLLQSPLSVNQHAFRNNYSTDTALATTVHQIESAVFQGDYALVVFLDIQGAFDNVPFSAVLQGFKDKGYPAWFLQWYKHYLHNRQTSVTLKHTKMTKHLARGVPQGGVLSPLAWNIAFESFLRLFQSGSVRVTGFADDAALIITGPNPHILRKLMQEAIDKALAWGRQNHLVFSASKTEAMLFSRRSKKMQPARLRMGNTLLPYSPSARYLGVHLDTKLSWRDHLEIKIKAAKYSLLKLSSGMGKLWGAPPQMVRYAYTCIIRPALTYGCLVWGSVIDKLWAVNALRKAQRLALLSMGHFRRKSPTAGLEVILGVPPLEIHIRGLATAAFLRTKSGVQLRGKPLRSPMTKWAHQKFWAESCNALSLPSLPEDTMPTRFHWGKKFHVNRHSFTTGTPVDDLDTAVYTDGSGYCDAFGSGFVIYRNDVEEHRDRFYLGRLSTVFQAEVNAIREAADYLLPTGDQRLMVTFYVDSQAAILALDSNLVKSRVVWDCIESLNALGRKTQISIRWVKAHVGIWGNEAADDMAQMGALNTGLAHGPEPFLPVSQAVLKSFLNTALLDYWTATWQARPDCRQTKIWFPKVDLLKSAKVVSRNRDEISGLVQILTGHNFMNRHNHVIDQDEPAECRLCLEDEESSWHVVAECPALALPRLQVFESHALESPPDWSVTQLSRFLRVPAMRSLLDWVGVE